jgi:hypothetical protein
MPNLTICNDEAVEIITSVEITQGGIPIPIKFKPVPAHQLSIPIPLKSGNYSVKATFSPPQGQCGKQDVMEKTIYIGTKDEEIHFTIPLQ